MREREIVIDASSDREQRLNDILAAHLEAVDAGAGKDWRLLQKSHPDLAADIADFFEGQQQAAHLALPLRELVQTTMPVPPGSHARELPAALELGDFRIVREIGRGGMGIVYEAEQKSLGRRVALKVLPWAATLDGQQLQRFHNEAQAAARLHHTNIVPVFEVGCADSVHYYAMQLIGGHSLAVLLREQCVPEKRSAVAETPGADVAPTGPAVLQPANEEPTRQTPSPWSATSDAAYRHIARLGVQAAEALEHAHRRGVLHRDIKPANLLLDPGGNLWITDFGLARTGGAELTLSGDVVGTLRYLAPERFSGACDARSDVYSLGLTLYELLTRRPAFSETRQEALLKQVLETEPVRPRQVDARIPRDLETIVLKAASKEPARRYDSAQDLAEDLRRFLADEPIHARPLGPLGRLAKWARRRPAVAALSGLVVAVAALGFALVTWKWLEAEHHKDVAIDNARAEGLARRQAEHRLAENCLERGLTHGDQQEAGRGLLWLARALKEVPPESADLAWNIRVNLTAWEREISPLRACLVHPDVVRAVAISPDGKTVLTGGLDHQARLWDAQTGRPSAAPLTHAERIFAVAFSADSKLAATASADGTARLWDTATGEPRSPPLSHGRTVHAVGFSPDGSMLLTGADDGARLWDVRSGKQRGTVLSAKKTILSVAFSPNNSIALTGTADGVAELWDSTTGALLGRVEHDRTAKDGAAIRTVAFSPNGQMILTASDDHTARLWDALTQKERCPPLRHEMQVFAAAFSPDGRTIVTGSTDQTARLWDAATGKRQAVLAHRGYVFGVAFSPDSHAVLTGGSDHTARLWDRATGQPLGPPLPHRNIVSAVAFSTDGKTIATADHDRTVKLWTPARATAQVLPHDGPVRAVAFGHDGQMVLTASADKKGRLFRLPGTLPAHVLTHEHAVWAAAFSPDGQFVVTGGSDDHVARIWSVATGKPVGKPLEHKGPIRAVAISPDSRFVLTSSGDGTAQHWHAARGEPFGPSLLHKQPVLAVAFGPDGTMVATASADHTARCWRVAGGEAVGEPLRHGDVVHAVAFAPDGKRLVTASADRSARIWDVASGASIPPALMHEDWVWTACFSPNGRLVVTASADKTARIWDASTGRPVGPPLTHRDHIRAAAFSPDGRMVVTGSDDGTARLWDARLGKALGPPLLHGAGIRAVAFSPRGDQLLTGSFDKTARLWPTPAPSSEASRRALLRISVITGLELDEFDVLRVLTPAAWEERKRQLEAPGER